MDMYLYGEMGRKLTHIKLHSCPSFCLYSFDGLAILTNNKTYNISRNRNLEQSKHWKLSVKKKILYICTLKKGDNKLNKS